MFILLLNPRSITFTRAIKAHGASPCQPHAGLQQDTVFQLQQEVTRQNMQKWFEC